MPAQETGSAYYALRVFNPCLRFGILRWRVSRETTRGEICRFRDIRLATNLKQPQTISNNLKKTQTISNNLEQPLPTQPLDHIRGKNRHRRSVDVLRCKGPPFVMTNSGCTVRDYSCMQMTSNASQDDGSWPRQDLHYISIHYPGPRPCTTQMNSFFTSQRNLICSWWGCCQLCSRNCISSLNNEKLHNFSTPPLGRARPECTDGLSGRRRRRDRWRWIRASTQ